LYFSSSVLRRLFWYANLLNAGSLSSNDVTDIIIV
jgi:hypothetical protein